MVNVNVLPLNPAKGGTFYIAQYAENFSGPNQFSPDGGGNFGQSPFFDSQSSAGEYSYTGAGFALKYIQDLPSLGVHYVMLELTWPALSSLQNLMDNHGHTWPYGVTNYPFFDTYWQIQQSDYVIPHGNQAGGSPVAVGSISSIYTVDADYPSIYPGILLDLDANLSAGMGLVTNGDPPVGWAIANGTGIIADNYNVGPNGWVVSSDALTYIKVTPPLNAEITNYYIEYDNGAAGTLAGMFETIVPPITPGGQILPRHPRLKR